MSQLHLPDCRWDFIGSIQKNKAAKIAAAFSLIHSVDTFDLAEKISQVSLEKGTTTAILLQVNVSKEASKHGLSPDEWERNLEKVQNLPHLCIKGLMTLAPFTTDRESIRSCFRKTADLLRVWQKKMQEPLLFQELSMGMSGDFEIAIQEGATLLRIGSALFNPPGSFLPIP